MERAAGRKVTPGLLKGHAPVDYLDDIDPGQEFVNKMFRYLATHHPTQVRLPRSVARLACCQDTFRSAYKAVRL